MQKEEYIVKGRAYIFALISCVAALALYWLFRKIWPVEPFRCADGWLSPSIGIQGACSHHGGVVGGDTMPWFMKFVGPIVGVRTFLMLSKKFKAYTVVVVGKYGASKIGECADLLEKAIVLNMCIEFQYLKKNETYPTKRTVKPYTLNCGCRSTVDPDADSRIDPSCSRISLGMRVASCSDAGSVEDQQVRQKWLNGRSALTARLQ